MGNKFITVHQFEAITEKILTDCGISLEWTPQFAPIDIDAIIEFHYELSFDTADLTLRTGEEDVLAAICAEKRVIYLNDRKLDLLNSNDGLMRFTKAHELGHWVLHIDKLSLEAQTTLLDLPLVNLICRSNQKDPREVQADMFAAHILMPTPLITAAFYKLEQRVDRVSWSELYKLKNKFDVSISALCNRLNDLHLCYIPNGENNIYRSKEEWAGQLSLF